MMMMMKMDNFDHYLTWASPQVKIRRGVLGRGRVGDVLGGDFVLRGPNPILKSDQIVMCLRLWHHMVESRSPNGP